MIGYRLLAAMLALTLLTAAGDLPTTLRRGVNITHWFRFPPRHDPTALRDYLDDAALAELKHAGFTFVRVAVQPDLLAQPDALVSAVARLQRHGLAVIVALFATDWHLEISPADQAKLFETWHSLAPLLRRFDPAATFPEVLNEPVFAKDPDAWARLQHQAVLTIRAILPKNTIGNHRGRLGQHRRSPVATARARPQRDLQFPPVRACGIDRPRRLPNRARHGGHGAPALPGHRRRFVQSHCRFDRRSADRRPDALLLCAALGCDEADCADRRGRQMGAGSSGRGAGGRIRRLAKPKRAGARGLAQHRAHGV
jgi:hypothetical protein